MTDEAVTAVSHPIALGSAELIRNIDELKSNLQKGLEAQGTVVVDATSVDTIDTASLQLLVAFANTLRKESRTLEWLNPSDMFVEMAELVDLAQPLALHVLATATPPEAEAVEPAPGLKEEVPPVAEAPIDVPPVVPAVDVPPVAEAPIDVPPVVPAVDVPPVAEPQIDVPPVVPESAEVVDVPEQESSDDEPEAKSVVVPEADDPAALEPAENSEEEAVEGSEEDGSETEGSEAEEATEEEESKIELVPVF